MTTCVMSRENLKEVQKPLKEQYERDPDAANITLTATGEERDDVRACNVDIGRALYEAELHEGAGGPGTGACSGDLLLGALSACAQLTAQAVADAFDIDADISVEVEGDLDLRGTLGVDEDVPVGFEDVRLSVTVDTATDVDDETAAALREYTERYCVVYQTLVNPPSIDPDWTIR